MTLKMINFFVSFMIHFLLVANVFFLGCNDNNSDSLSNSNTNTNSGSTSNTDINTGADITGEITMSEAHIYLLVGGSHQLTVASEDGSLTWSTENDTIATVDQIGNVTAVAKGKTNIIATSEEGATGSCEVTVTLDANLKTYYLSPDGNDDNDGSSGSPWETFAHAFSVMDGGDTLIVRDGLYQQQVRDIPSGTPDAYTYVKAEHDFGVIIDGADLPGDYDRTLFLDDASYINIQGIKFKSGSTRVHGGAGYISFSNHIKVIRCAFYDAPNQGNVAAVFAGTGSSYILFEECYSYGSGRYKFVAYGDSDVLTEKIIFRRCVARHDFHYPDDNWGRLCATFTAYDVHDVLFQNCISIDSGHDEELYGRIAGGLNFVCKETTPADISGRVQGCIFLNQGGWAAIRDPKNNGERIIENTVFWDCAGGYYSTSTVESGDPTLFINHMTIGDIWGTSTDLSYSWGTGVYNGKEFSLNTINNSIITQCNSAGLYDYMDSDYNDLYQNVIDYANHWGIDPPVAGANDTNIDPALKYICRIEDDSPLKGAASDAGDIGANVLYQYGVSGTLYGEEGYDTLTNIPLWPFPNEDEIKTQMSTWSGPNDGKRGFCADGNGLYGGPVTLTSYIWEYLGNPCPEGICN